jgi:hypothetical protein
LGESPFRIVTQHTLATRGVKGSSYYPANRFDALPDDTEPEDVPEMQGIEPVIRQTEEYADEEHMPQFSRRAMTYGLEQEEAQDRMSQATFTNFSHNILGNSSAQVSDDSDVPPQGESIPVLTRDMQVVSDSAPNTQETTVEDVHMVEVAPGIWESPSVAPYAWSNSYAQARQAGLEQRAMEQHFSWMTEADLHMFQFEYDPVLWDHFAEVTEQEQEWQFQEVKNR